MSASSGVPMGPTLLVRLLRQNFPLAGVNSPTDDRLKKLAYEFPFETIVEAVERNFGRTRDDLTDFLKAIYIDTEYPLSDGHHDFLSICFWGGIPRLDMIFTTNFDNLLEKILGEYIGIPITEKKSKEIRKVQDKGQIPIIHLHGQLDGQYQITEKDVFNEQYKVITGELRAALVHADAFVFVGYSMNDPDFRRLYRNYRDDIIGRGDAEKKTYVVSPAEDEYSYRLGSDIWMTRGAEWIPLDANTFFARLKSLMESQADSQLRSEVMKKYRLSDDQALDELITRTAELLGIGKSEALHFMYEARTRVGGAK